MTLKFLPCLELEVVGVECFAFDGSVVEDNDREKGQATDPDQERPIEAIALEHLSHHQHESCPKVVGGTYLEEFGCYLGVVGLFDGIVPELPEGKYEDYDYVEGRPAEGAETEEELKHNLVNDKHDFAVGVLPCCQLLGSHPRLEQCQGHNCGNYHKESDEEEGDGGVEEMPPFPANHLREVHHMPNVVGLLALHHVEEDFSDGEEEDRDEEGNYLCKDDEGKGEFEFFFTEGVADIDDVDHYEQDYEDEEVQHKQECSIGGRG